MLTRLRYYGAFFSNPVTLLAFSAFFWLVTYANPTPKRIVCVVLFLGLVSLVNIIVRCAAMLAGWVMGLVEQATQGGGYS